MNAIILAAGNSLRMYQTGANIHKALLPIQNVPNIERTILMLHCCNITEIIIAVPYECSHFDYLEEKYSCKIIHKRKACTNTLHTISTLLKYIDDTFIIEGDVVLAKNIFDVFENSTYYVMKYPSPEIDDWHPILNQDGNISSFQINQEKTPAIFGISFWAHKDCPLLISHLLEKASIYNIQDSNIFWDNNIIELIDKVTIKTCEISANVACEMNTYDEYQFAQTLCKNVVYNSHCFFDNVSLRIEDGTYYKIFYSIDQRKNIYWINQLFRYYGEKLINEEGVNYEEYVSSKEHVFIVQNNSCKEIAFFSIVQEQKYILLRRLYINSDYRRKHIGKQIVRYIQLFSKLNSRELRVNVYDDKAEKFYMHLGFKAKFKTLELEP